MPRTAAALIIGNEILTGKIQESNVSVLAKELFTLGIELSRVVVCQDDIATIADDLDFLRSRHDYVITSGGVGPTHDDVTLKAVARAFETEIVRSPELEARIRELVTEEVTEGHLRMADVPDGARLVNTDQVRWPTVVMDNVFILPGVPKIFAMKLPVLRAHLEASDPFRSRAVYTLCRETDLASLLDRLAAEHRGVDIGSYPVFGDYAYSVRLTFDSKDQVAIDQAVDALLAELPSEMIVPEDVALES
ncbi:MAG: competence/damage-inducible protein A [Acidobacteriota bacterium]